MIPCHLTMKLGPTPGKVIQLDKPLLAIGRDLSNDIVIPDADVSRKHARLSEQGDDHLLEDLGSTNGTFVNGERLAAERTLQPGDVVRLGETVELVYERPSFDAQATVLAGQAESFTATTADIPEPIPAPEPEPAPAVSESETFIASIPPEDLPAPAAHAPEPAPEVAFQPEAALPEQPKKSKKVWLFVGIGCAVLACVCVVLGVAGYLFWQNL